MPDGLDDLDDMAGDDVQKMKQSYRRYKHGGGIQLGGIIEYVLWFLTILGLAFMLGSMWFVGEGAVLTGEQWLVTSFGWMAAFGSLAMFIRLFRNGTIERYLE